MSQNKPAPRYLWVTYINVEGDIKIRLEGLNGLDAHFCGWTPAQIRALGHALIQSAERSEDAARTDSTGAVAITHRYDINSPLKKTTAESAA